ncbi:MAG: MATE family efflux transporter, partial [Prevotella sp.]|nr:MATE family efflux transporter [Prevotella sp.]
ILAGNVVTHTYLGLNAVLRAASKPRQAMNATIFTVVFNTILDPIFIYPWGLGLGISGAAYATILAQILALCYQARLLGDKRQLIHFSRGTYKLQSQIIKNIIAIGVSPFAMNVCSCIIVIFINNQLVSYGGDLAVGAYGISNKILFVFTMFVLGLNQGMQPIAGYNFGAQRFDRLMRVVKLTMLSATAVVTVGWCFAMFLPQLCVRLFTTDATLIGIAANALRISGCMFPIVGYQMVTTNFFQCIGKVKVSIFLSLSRQLIFLLPMLWLLPHFFQLNGVWFSMPTSDLLASIVTAWVMVRYMRMFKRQQQEKDGAA